MKRSKKIALITWMIVITLAVIAILVGLFLYVKKDDRSSIATYDYPENFEMTDEIKHAMNILVLYDYGGHNYDNSTILEDSGMWEQYFINEILLNNTYSFEYLDKLSEEHDGKISKEDAEYMQYSLTGQRVTFTSSESENIDRHNLNDYKDGSYATFKYCDFKEKGDEVIGTARYILYYSVVLDDNGESEYLPVETDIKFVLKKNPESCFDGYSFVKLEYIDDEITETAETEKDVEEQSGAESEAASTENEIKQQNEQNDAVQESHKEEISVASSSNSNNFGPITTEEYNTFKKTSNEYVNTNKMQDIAALMTKDYTGTWYDPSNGEAIRLSMDGAYVYIPYLDMYGDTLYQWKLVDRSAQGACPMLEIFCWGTDTPGLAYYVAGYNENYFYGKLQGYVFYKQ